MKLRSRYRVVALSNTNTVHARRWSVRYDEALVHFERIFCSYEMGARKPERRAYDIVLEYLRIPAGRVIFIDDKPGNVLGAADTGIKGITVTSTSGLIADLEKLQIRI